MDKLRRNNTLASNEWLESMASLRFRFRIDCKMEWSPNTDRRCTPNFIGPRASIAPWRASLQRCGRQWTGGPLRRPPPIPCGKIQDPIRAASPSNRGRRLERRPPCAIRNERSKAMTVLNTTAASLNADARAFVLLKSRRRLDLLNPDPQAWTDD